MALDVDNESQVRMAVEKLEEDIAFGYMHPRERLVEDELRARFGLKRHIVRQVLADSWLYSEEIGLRPDSLDQLAEGNFPQLDLNVATASAN